MLYNLLIINPANLHTEIEKTVPEIIDLLRDKFGGVREASVNALSKFAEHSKPIYFFYVAC